MNMYDIQIRNDSKEAKARQAISGNWYGKMVDVSEKLVQFLTSCDGPGLLLLYCILLCRTLKSAVAGKKKKKSIAAWSVLFLLYHSKLLLQPIYYLLKDNVYILPIYNYLM